MILVKLPILLVGHSKKTTMGKAGMVMVNRLEVTNRTNLQTDIDPGPEVMEVGVEALVHRVRDAPDQGSW